MGHYVVYLVGERKTLVWYEKEKHNFSPERYEMNNV